MMRKVWGTVWITSRDPLEFGDGLQVEVKGREGRRDMGKGNDRQKGKKGGIKVSKAKYHVSPSRHMQKVHPKMDKGTFNKVQLS